MQITGTFLDEISYDIPHQNWGPKEWDRDFAAMKQAGIDTVILIRCGLQRFMTYPSKFLQKTQGCYMPPLDLVGLFLDLAEKYGMAFYFGLYDSERYWYEDKCEKELDISRHVAEEVWDMYNHKPAFKGWYLNCEISRAKKGIIDLYHKLGFSVKNMSGGLPVMISPYIAGVKAADKEKVTLSQHEKEWNEILAGIKGAVDIIAFQDGHCEYDELYDYLICNRDLAHHYGMQSWSNVESFDRDMPIRFLPIKWEKLRLKLEAARKAGLDKAITFEFSHFMSPNSMYPSAHGLFDRYVEYKQELTGTIY